MVDRPGPTMALPWASESGDQVRFGAVLVFLLLLFVPPALLIPAIELPEVPQEEREELAPQLATLLPEAEPVMAPEPVAEPEPVVEVEAEPEPTPEPEPAPEPAPQPEPEPAPAPREETVDQAREVASRSGLMAMQDQLAQMRSLAPSEAPQTAKALSSEAAQAAESGAGRTVTEEVFEDSGGLDDSGTPRENIQVASRQTQTLDEPSESAETGTPAMQDTGPEERTLANIRAIFDQNKTALFSLYNRALRKNPTLAGTVLLELVIEPNGQVKSVEVVSSELDDAELEQRLAARVQLFDFGRANVAQRTVEYPVNFLPPG